MAEVSWCICGVDVGVREYAGSRLSEEGLPVLQGVRLVASMLAAAGDWNGSARETDCCSYLLTSTPRAAKISFGVKPSAVWRRISSLTTEPFGPRMRAWTSGRMRF
eukprot:2473077-Rhodomonas_salina.5